MKRAIILALAMLAAGCTEEPDTPPAQQGGEAAGEVLGGTISDAMIPLEQLRSEAPLMPRQTAVPGASENEGDSEGDGEGDGEGAAADEATDQEARGEGAEAAPAAPAPVTPATAE